ncbi:histidine phosphatase superfamily [Roridomyces roridus]|uniref:Histidine phosphatase superfamily n=1 Tax=Roridomyces roridus TaxID=1738132 RepID=A0AAD7CCY8_9AGAR|nr:histidine phosphatase superfamily [Roridomyces roridus]
MSTFSYQTIPGFFAQDDRLADPIAIGAVPPRFGLIDESETRWSSLLDKLRELNGADDTASYKLVFFGRHGQGYHNVAESKYGTDAWDDYWAMLYGDGETTWGPDPELTTLGKAQAATAHAVWVQERAASTPIPLPETQYCSPMTRALDTHMITFEGVTTIRALVLENCREEYGAHTCDQRKTRTQIAGAFPSVDIEPGLTEVDELWTAKRETFEHVVRRARAVLDRIFGEVDGEALFVSVTAHGGIINAFLNVLGRERYPLPTGGVLPVVIKATRAL